MVLQKRLAVDFDEQQIGQTQNSRTETNGKRKKPRPASRENTRSILRAPFTHHGNMQVLLQHFS